ncbi:MAG: GIY-YIG nuclease family protein [Candidatus Kaiserbacteria bacterium]|nr:MAG: GIY-YIG nuclease family protein [Candidatus Kaiserbacteria bacterium]
MFYVYILQSSKDTKLYAGYTSDLRRRFSEHNDGLNKSTKPRVPFKLLYYEAYSSQADAERREQMLKKSAGARTALKRRLTTGLRSGHFV